MCTCRKVHTCLHFGIIRIKIRSDNFYGHIELSLGIKCSDNKVLGLGSVFLQVQCSLTQCGGWGELWHVWENSVAQTSYEIMGLLKCISLWNPLPPNQLKIIFNTKHSHNCGVCTFQVCHRTTCKELCLSQTGDGKEVYQNKLRNGRLV